MMMMMLVRHDDDDDPHHHHHCLTNIIIMPHQHQPIQIPSVLSERGERLLGPTAEVNQQR